MIPIVRRVNQFSIAKFDYVLNENPFLFNRDSRLSDVRNFASTIWRLRGKSKDIDDNQYIMGSMQFDEALID